MAGDLVERVNARKQRLRTEPEVFNIDRVRSAIEQLLAPDNPVYLAFLAGAVKRELPEWERVEINLGEQKLAGMRSTIND